MFLPLESVTLRNFLSFGPESDPVELRALNVIIGANGSGKSNFVEAVNFLKYASDDLGLLFRQGGGFRQWIWKGGEGEPARLEFEGHVKPQRPFAHSITFAASGTSFEVTDESLAVSGSSPRLPTRKTFAYENGQPVLRPGTRAEKLARGDVNVSQSVVSEEQDRDFGQKVRLLGRLYKRFAVYDARYFNAISDKARVPPPADVPSRYLSRNGSNLAAVLARLKADRVTSQNIDRYMESFYDGYDGLTVTPAAGVLQLALNESFFRDGTPISRLSDGTIRWLGLLAILLDPEPAPLVCIEEPESGLHPDVVVVLADLLREASERTQLIVTTHSDILIDALTDVPESVVVCDKEEGATRLKRLDSKKLAAWLAEYSLGPLWRRNQLGGNRW